MTSRENSWMLDLAFIHDASAIHGSHVFTTLAKIRDILSALGLLQQPDDLHVGIVAFRQGQLKRVIDLPFTSDIGSVQHSVESLRAPVDCDTVLEAFRNALDFSWRPDAYKMLFFIESSSEGTEEQSGLPWGSSDDWKDKMPEWVTEEKRMHDRGIGFKRILATSVTSLNFDIHDFFPSGSTITPAVQGLPPLEDSVEEPVGRHMFETVAPVIHQPYPTETEETPAQEDEHVPQERVHSTTLEQPHTADVGYPGPHEGPLSLDSDRTSGEECSDIAFSEIRPSDPMAEVTPLLSTSEVNHHFIADLLTQIYFEPTPNDLPLIDDVSSSNPELNSTPVPSFERASSPLSYGGYGDFFPSIKEAPSMQNSESTSNPGVTGLSDTDGTDSRSSEWLDTSLSSSDVDDGPEDFHRPTTLPAGMRLVTEPVEPDVPFVPKVEVTEKPVSEDLVKRMVYLYLTRKSRAS